MIGKTLSRILTSYYRGPDHPLKLRLWRYLRQASHYSPLTVAYGNGAWISIDERDWLQSSIFASGSYEPEVWSALSRYATGDDIVWDVGANIGSFALIAAQDRRVHSVCAFEPDPLTLEVLKRNLALNGNPAVVYPVALSDTSERKTLIHGPHTNSGMSTFSPTVHTGMTRHVSGARCQLPTFEVECVTADDLVAHADAPAPTLMKIDVEGWEYQVLSGARQLLGSTRVRALAFEAHSNVTGELGDEALERLLTTYGYSISHVRRPGGELRAVENYLAVLR